MDKLRISQYLLTLTVILASAVCAGAKDAKQPLQCWECSNFDATGKFYAMCPMDGTVDPVRAYQGNCSGKCFTHTDDRNKESVVRGCTGSQYGLPDPLPADGCYPWYSELWCVCATDGCNGVALGKPKGDKEFDAHIDYSKPQGGDASSAFAVTSSYRVTVIVTAFVVIGALRKPRTCAGL